jgi:hypothetical protein
MRHHFAVALAFGLLTSSLSAQTIVYLNFDEQETVDQWTDDGEGNLFITFANRDPYTPGASEIGPTLPAPFHELNLRFEMKSTEFGGPAFGPTPAYDGPKQGGKSLLLPQDAGEVAGIRIISDNGVAPSSFTMEAVWWTDDLEGQGNTVGIQSIMGSEAVGGQELGAFFVRTVYVGGTQYMDYWTDRGDSNNEAIRVVGPTAYPVSRLVHDAFVFEFNPDNPAQCTVRAYRDGALLTILWPGTPHNGQTSAPYNALFPRPDGPGLVPTTIFGVRGTIDPEEGALRMIAIGYNSSHDPDNDIRALRGGIDAFALTVGALTPDNFVLPSGTPIPFPEAEQVDSFGIF